MNIYGTHQLSSSLQLQRTHPAHYSSNSERASGQAGDAAAGGLSFAELLREGVERVNQAQQSHEALATQAIINPNEVDVHDVTIAAAQADLSIQLARNIIDRALNTYRELTTLR